MTSPEKNFHMERNYVKTPSRHFYTPYKCGERKLSKSPVNSFKPLVRRNPFYPEASKFTNKKFARKEHKSHGPKYIVENIEKGIESSALYDYFKAFGSVDKLNIREKGIDQQNVSKCTAFLQFYSEPYDGFLNIAHTFNENTLTVRSFIEGKDAEKLIDDWGSDEIDQSSRVKRPRSRSLSPSPRKYQRNERRGRSRSKSCYRGHSQYDSRVSSSSSEDIPKTRSISVPLMFQKVSKIVF